MKHATIDLMPELEQLIRKFWANQTTKPENQHLLQLLEEYQAKTAAPVEEDAAPVLAPDRAAFILEKIHGRLGIDAVPEERKNGMAVVRKLYRRLAVAAVVATLALGTFLWTGGRHSTRSSVTVAPAATPPLVSVINRYDSAMSLVLEDGSAIVLEKNSSISYYKPFINGRRDISLKGMALFKVAKDRVRPFTVYAGGVATTALGTRFVVNATDSRKVLVKLLDGKVVIKTAAGSNLAMKDIYLSPGEQFSLDKVSRQYTLNTIQDKPAAGDAVRLADKSELVFHKEPLGKVFEKVGHLFKIPLTFRKEDMNGLYFTGTFLHSDNLDIVLSTICNVNDLLVTKNGDSITITRPH